MKFAFPPESKPLDGYTIKRAIHRGGFGEVYYALSDGGKEVALKLLRQNLDIELRGVAQCLNLKHPNLVTIFDVRTDDDGDHWIVMEFVSGRSLAETIDSRGALPIEEAGRWLAGIADGLEYLHDRGIVHRDLKPANIYRDGGIVKIGDVGLSKFISESRRSAQTESVGTVYYMAPEVAHGRYGREVDVYSLGVILYEMLTGRVPFDGESTGEILMKHLTEKPDLSTVPESVRPVLARALQKDPLKRTPSARELHQEFNKAARGEEVPAEIPSESFVEPSEDRSPRSDVPTEVYIPAASVRHETRRAAEDLRHGVHRSAKRFRRKVREAARQAHKAAKHERRAAKHRYRAEKYGANVSKATPNGTAYRSPVSRSSAEDRRDGGRDAQVSYWLKVGAVVLVLWALFAPRSLFGSFRALFIGAVFAALGYGLYRLISYLTTPVPSPTPVGSTARREEPPAPPSEQPQPPVHVAVGRGKPKRRLYTPETLRSIPLRYRMADLTGAMTYAVLATALVTAGIWAVLPAAFVNSELGAVGLFSLTTLLGSWALLIPAKLWEGSRTEPHIRRLTQLGAGAVVGAAAYWLHRNLMVSVDYGLWEQGGGVYAVFKTLGSRNLVAAGQPTLAAYMLFFGILFLVRRWWRHGDAFRKKRFRLGSLLLTGVAGFVLPMLLAFPHLWGLLWALAISIVVQLSAAWVPPDERARLMEGSSDATDA